jgi:hypothetical protein
MRIQSAGLAFVLGVAITGCSEQGNLVVPGPERVSIIYPDTLDPISGFDQQALLDRFQDRNPGVCAAFDSYGRPRAGIDCDEPSEQGVADSASAVALALDFLKRNRIFFNLSSDLPAVARVRQAPVSDHWAVTFAQQSVGEYEVDGTAITVRLARTVYAVEGGHYRKFSVPTKTNLDPDQARSVLPTAIVFPCWSPMDASLGAESHPVIIPLPTDSHIPAPPLEMRATYRFSYQTGFGQTVLDSYVDVMTGETVASRPRIIC